MAEGGNKQLVVAMVPLARIDMGERLRDLDDAWVEILVASLAEEGLHNPVQVTEADAGGRHRLVAGAHRLAAARALGWKSIPAFLFSGTQLEATLRQIDENLLRRDLVALDRAIFLAERKRVYEAAHPETRNGAVGRGRPWESVANLANLIPGEAKSSERDRNEQRGSVGDLISGRAPRFSRVSAQRLAGSERSIQRVIARGMALAPDVARLLAGSKWAKNGRALDRIGFLSGAEQREVAIALTRPEGPARNFDAALAEVRGAAKLPPPAPRNPLFTAWERASTAQRAEFVAWVRETQIKEDAP